MDFAERAARNEEIFRDVNKRIQESAEEQHVESEMPFHCECTDASCLDKVDLSLRNYERVVEERYHFVVIPGHQNAQVERVVEEHDTFVVVEKVGEAREQIDRDHPQERHQD
jgi:hypothetical protein